MIKELFLTVALALPPKSLKTYKQLCKYLDKLYPNCAIMLARNPAAWRVEGLKRMDFTYKWMTIFIREAS